MKDNSGFTLIELIIVIAILAIISAIAIPNIIFAVDNARIATDLSNAKVIADSFQIVISKDNDVNRVDFTDKEFTKTSSEAGALKELIEAAAMEIQSVPMIKHGPDSGSSFNVTIGGSSGIVVKAGATEIYPNPQGAWAY
jgi:prepilin-type N-terminal cleavage/methylation domain-containing protein